jgi:C4-dicarboxylate transporter, DctM subunit
MEWKDQSIYPASAPPAERLPWRQRLKPTLAVWPVITVFVFVVTGMCAGWFSATEGAAVVQRQPGFWQ